MNALLLAAGYGTRLGELTKQTPKCLVKVNSQTMLDHWLIKLNRLGVQNFIINTHHLHISVEQFVERSKFSDRIQLSFENELLGTAGTLLAHSDVLSTTDAFVVHVDNFCADNLDNFLVAHKARPIETVFSMLTFKSNNPENCGVVETDAYDRVIKFHEKVKAPPTDIANGAVYIVTPDFFKDLRAMAPRPKDISLDVIPKLLGRGYCYRTLHFFSDIGTPEDLERTQRWCASQIN